MIICINSNNLETLEQQLSFIGANLYGEHDIYVYSTSNSLMNKYDTIKKCTESDFIKELHFREKKRLLHDLNFYTSKKRSEQNWVFLLKENEHLSSLLTQQLPIVLGTYEANNYIDVLTLPRAYIKGGEWINQEDPRYQPSIVRIGSGCVWKDEENPTIYNYKKEVKLQEREFSLLEFE